MLALHVLVASSDEVFCWVENDDTNGVPIGAVTRDCSPDGTRNYVIRAYYNGVLYPGNYEEGKNYAEIQYHGARLSNDWGHLVSNEDVAGMNIHVLTDHYMGLLPDTVNLRAAHAPGMPGFANWRFPLKLVAGKSFPAWSAHAQPTILHIWLEAHRRLQ